jgi:hypothetical protein
MMFKANELVLLKRDILVAPTGETIARGSKATVKKIKGDTVYLRIGVLQFYETAIWLGSFNRDL